jgi:hypothetical protein
MIPDGAERKVVSKLVGGKWRHRFPWEQLNDGDFFIVPITGNDRAMRVSFQQAAARHDIEISIHPSRVGPPGEEVDGFRVCRIIGGIHKIKAEARKRGANTPSSDIKQYYRRQAAWRRGEPLTTPPAMSIAPTPPTAPLVPIGEAATAPLGTDAQQRYDREQRLAEARRRAEIELAGIDPDEDFNVMGVGGEVNDTGADA